MPRVWELADLLSVFRNPLLGRPNRTRIETRNARKGNTWHVGGTQSRNLFAD